MCRKRNQIISLKEDKDPEELTYINDVTTSLPCRSPLGGVSPPLSLRVFVSALLLS